MKRSRLISLTLIHLLTIFAMATHADQHWEWSALPSDGNEPSIRRDHAVVSTGTEIIVWGGRDYTSQGLPTLDTGSYYNLTTDLWTVMSPANAPTDRANFAAVWTGTRLFIWGGIQYPTNVHRTDGALYDPVTDTWTPISNTGAPSERIDMVAVWTGSHVMVGGGERNNTAHRDYHLYDPVTDTWVQLPNFPLVGRHTADNWCWTGRYLVMWGGKVPYQGILGDGAIYDAIANQWSSMSSSPAGFGPRNLHRLVHIGGGNVLIWGGEKGTGSGPYLGDGTIYHTGTDSWSSINNDGAPSPRALPGLVYNGTKVIVWGGYANPQYYDDGAEYNPSMNSWELMNPSNPPAGRLFKPMWDPVWTGKAMFIWGDPRAIVYRGSTNYDGGRYGPSNRPPIADADGPYVVNEGSNIQLDASASSDPDGDPLTYEWDLDYDGVSFDVDLLGMLPVVGSPLVDDDLPSRNMALRVTDPTGDSSLDVTIFQVNNIPPTVCTSESITIAEGTTFASTGSFSDPGTDSWIATVDYGEGSGSQPLLLAPDKTFTLNHVYVDDGFYTVTVTVTDDDGGIGTATTDVVVTDLAPSADFTWAPEPQDEGSPVLFTDQSTSSPDEIVSWFWDFGDGSIGNDPNPSHTYSDNDVFTVALTVTDDDGSTEAATHNVTILNVAPTVGDIVAPIEPVEVETPVLATASFTDPGTADTHTATWDWGDDTDPSSGTVTESNGSGTVTGTHTYTTPGVYTLTLTVTDDDGDSGESTYQFVVVYDPDGGFVTGGGWIQSPPDAYVADPDLTGKANFGFVSKYKKGASTPTGETEFNFRVADLNFHSSSYEWLIIAGANAKYKGDGTINGDGNYGFMLTATDADIDLFRIKIWDKDDGDAVVYDNQPGEEDDSDAGTEIGGGNIKVHKPANAAPSLVDLVSPVTQALSVEARSTETVLLRNFPNPFNPETWLPYTLSTDATVTIRIYNTQGQLVRHLDLGHQSAGYYLDRDAAAYWDGRNSVGQQVANGSYYYQLQAGDFTAIRRMVILK